MFWTTDILDSEGRLRRDEEEDVTEYDQSMSTTTQSETTLETTEGDTTIGGSSFNRHEAPKKRSTSNGFIPHHLQPVQEVRNNSSPLQRQPGPAGGTLSESRTEMDRTQSHSSNQREPVPFIAPQSLGGKHTSSFTTKTIHDNTMATTSSKVLDLKHNDNSFHVIAKLVIDRFEDHLNREAESFTLTAGDRCHLDRVVPAKSNFIEAVKYRLQNCPEHSSKPIHLVTRQCRALGLHLEGNHNLLNAPVGTKIRIDVSTVLMELTCILLQKITNFFISLFKLKHFVLLVV
jgi:hypothetical protein